MESDVPKFVHQMLSDLLFRDIDGELLISSRPRDRIDVPASISVLEAVPVFGIRPRVRAQILVAALLLSIGILVFISHLVFVRCCVAASNSGSSGCQH